MALKDISFMANGIDRRILCDSDRSLLRVLREDLGLTGAKEGCGKGHCGTCAVLVAFALVPVLVRIGKREPDAVVTPKSAG